MKIRGEITVPGDKSISHRALLISALATGSSVLSSLNLGADVLNTLAILQQLGVEVREEGQDLVVQGRDFQFEPPRHYLDCGNSGTTMRLLAGILAGQRFTSTLQGDSSLQNRPMARIMEPLSAMGATIKGNQGTTTAPLTIIGGQLRGIHYRLPVASAQVKSAVLFAGLQADGRTTIIEPVASRDHTERMLEYCGVPLERSGQELKLRGNSKIEGRQHKIPGDFSSAAYLIAATLGLPGSELIVTNLNLNWTRVGLLEVLETMGAKIELLEETSWGSEPVGDLLIRSSKLNSCTISGTLIPRLIDEIPVLAVLATQAAGETVITDALELRHKETDRLRCLATELTKLGADVREQEAGLVIKGPTTLVGGRVNSFGDHRLALAFKVASLFAAGPVEIVNQACAEISYPGFSKDLERLIVG